jgi:hypothetical protein
LGQGFDPHGRALTHRLGRRQVIGQGKSGQHDRGLEADGLLHVQVAAIGAGQQHGARVSAQRVHALGQGHLHHICPGHCLREGGRHRLQAGCAQGGLFGRQAGSVLGLARVALGGKQARVVGREGHPPRQLLGHFQVGEGIGFARLGPH